MPEELPPAGWYADPELPEKQRYWDGTRWSPRRRALPDETRTEPTLVGGASDHRPSAPIWVWGSIGVIIIGSVSPWATSPSIGAFGDVSVDTVNGLEGDGIVTVLAAVVAAALIWLGIGRSSRGRTMVLAAAVLGALVVLTALIDLSNIGDTAGASAQWGIYVVLLGGGALAVSAFELSRRLSRPETRTSGGPAIADDFSAASDEEPRCERCGGEIRSGDPFCPLCGARQQAST